MQFWKDHNIYDCIKNPAWARYDVTEKSINDIWKRTLQRFVHDFKVVVKDEKIAKVNNAV